MAFFYRSGPVDTRFLEWRVGLFTVGGGLALAGMLLVKSDWMVVVAIVILVAGFTLRFVPRSGDVADEEEEDEDDEES